MVRTLLVIAAAALAWRWYANREPGEADDDLELDTATAAADDELVIAGARYRVVGQPTAAGLVPVNQVHGEGMMGAAVTWLYNPATGQLEMSAGLG